MTRRCVASPAASVIRVACACRASRTRESRIRFDTVYTVKEIFYTLQGEGYHTGRPAVFCRFSGCNLWTGLEKDRSDAICKFCDTDFFGVGEDGGKFRTAI